MTTDTKNVARWNLGFKGLSDRAAMLEHHKGHYILFTDHERVVGELQKFIEDAEHDNIVLESALAESHAEVERLRAGMQAILRVHANDNHRPQAFYIAARATDTAMEKGNAS